MKCSQKRIRETRRDCNARRDNFSMQTFSKKFPRIRASNISKRGGRKEEEVVAPWLSSFRSFTGPVVADNILTSFKSNEVYTHTHTRNTAERGTHRLGSRTPMHISSRAHPSYTRASEEVLFCTFPTLQPIFLCAITSASATDCERRMSRPIRNFLLRFVQDHSRQLKSSASSSSVHTNAPLLHHFLPFQSLFLFFSFLFPDNTDRVLSLSLFRSTLSFVSTPPLFLAFHCFFKESKKKVSLIPH